MSKDHLETPSPGDPQVPTILREFIQSTLESLEGGKVPEVVYGYVLACHSWKILRLRILSTSLCVFGQRYGLCGMG